MYRFTLLLSFTFASFCVNAYAQIYTPPKNIQLKLYNNDPNQIHVNIKPDNNNDNNENTLYYNVSYYSLNKGIGTESWFDNAAVGITCNSNHLKGSNSCDKALSSDAATIWRNDLDASLQDFLEFDFQKYQFFNFNI